MKKFLLSLMFVSSAVFAKSVVIDVVEHKPIYEVKQVYKDVSNCNSSNDYNVLGTVVGAVGGGVLGNQIGGGSGKKLATVAGAIAGGYAGNRIEDSVKNGDSGCSYSREPVEEKVLVGYRNIGYYNGVEYSKISDEKQSTIRVEIR